MQDIGRHHLRKRYNLEYKIYQRMQHLEKIKFLENIGFCVYDAYTIHRIVHISDMQSPRSRMRFPAPLYLRMRLPVAKL